MIEYVGLPLCTALVRLREIEGWLKPVRSGNLSAPGAEQVLREQLVLIEGECRRLGLESEAGLATELCEELVAGMPPAGTAKNLPTLQRMIERALARCFFIYLPAADSESFADPVRLFPKTGQSFSSAKADIRDAYRSRVLGQNTACVFHCMGVLQRGLNALAAKLVSVAEAL